MKNTYTIRDNVVVVLVIQRSGLWHEILLSIEDLPRLLQEGNSINLSGDGYVRIITTKGVQYLHRWVMQPQYFQLVDHKDHNKNNNTRQNLSLVTHAENSQNLQLNPRNKSGVRGISFDTRNGKWLVRLRIKNADYCIGRFYALELAKIKLIEFKDQLKEKGELL